MRYLPILALLLLAACAAHYKKPGATDQDFARDDYRCDLESHAASGDAAIIQLSLYDKCMKAHGWQKS